MILEEAATIPQLIPDDDENDADYDEDIDVDNDDGGYVVDDEDDAADGNAADGNDDDLEELIDRDLVVIIQPAAEEQDFAHEVEQGVGCGTSLARIHGELGRK